MLTMFWMSSLAIKSFTVKIWADIDKMPFSNAQKKIQKIFKSLVSHNMTQMNKI